MMLLRRRAMMGGAESLTGKLGSLSAGTKVQVESLSFIVVHQGNPDKSIYDASCDGTWLLMSDYYEERVWDSRNNYADSNIASWLASTFMGIFSGTVKASILPVKIPYYYNGSLHTLSNGFDCQAFLPAAVELGILPESNYNVPADGKTLEYFVGTNPNIGTSGADAKRGGTSGRYWTRTASTENTDDVFNCSSAGAVSVRDSSSSYGARPVIIMDKYTPIDGDEIAIVE